MFRLALALGFGAAMLVTSCDRGPSGTGSSSEVEAKPGTNRQAYEVKGLIVALKPGEKSVEIKHEAIPGYMPAMTMPFDVKDTNELAGLAPGESVIFRLTVTDMEGWIDQIRKTGAAATNSLPTNAPVRLARDVEPLQVGDPLPEYHFVNQFGHAISTKHYNGQALAITFLFTRCPFPTFCPRMANNFQEVQQKLLAIPGGPTNWELLTISFDPDFDKPEVLKAYAQSHQYNPEHWSFATGELIDVTAIGEQFGLAFWKDPSGSINHNLRTAVIAADGRVRKVFEGNEWKSDELVQEMVKAASVAR
jgi:protein SCO1/2